MSRCRVSRGLLGEIEHIITPRTVYSLLFHLDLRKKISSTIQDLFFITYPGSPSVQCGLHGTREVVASANTHLLYPYECQLLASSVIRLGPVPNPEQQQENHQRKVHFKVRVREILSKKLEKWKIWHFVCERVLIRRFGTIRSTHLSRVLNYMLVFAENVRHKLKCF